MQKLNRVIAKVLPEFLVEKIKRINGTSAQDTLREELESLKKELFDLRSDHMRLVQLMDIVENKLMAGRNLESDSPSFDEPNGEY